MFQSRSGDSGICTWVDPESQVFESSVKGKYCLEDKVTRRREELS